MIKGFDSVMLNSSDAKKLAEFYEKKVGLEKGEEFEMGEDGDRYFEFKVKPIGFGIADHSQIKGKTKEGKRVLLNFEVDDIDKEVKKLSDNGIKVIQEKYHVEGYGYIATFEDIDGNYFQLVQVRAN